MKKLFIFAFCALVVAIMGPVCLQLLQNYVTDQTAERISTMFAIGMILTFCYGVYLFFIGEI